MKLAPLYLTVTSITLLLLSIMHSSWAQIVGCDGDGVDCPTEKTDAKEGICSLGSLQETKNDGIGIVAFKSNITSEGSLTWTMTEHDYDPPMPFSERHFWLGTPPSLDLSEVTGLGGCALILASNNNLTSTLQPPPGFTDYSDFQCGTVMGETCAQDVLARVHDELMGFLNNNSSHNPSLDQCEAIGQRLLDTPLPGSCLQSFKAETFAYLMATALTNHTVTYQSQDSCSLTTGGSNYRVGSGPFVQFRGKSNSDEIMAWKNGTTPVLTLFYNTPWNNATTGPSPLLIEPEVHLSCLRKVPTAEQQSGSVRVQGNLGLAGLFLCYMLWGLMAF